MLLILVGKIKEKPLVQELCVGRAKARKVKIENPNALNPA